MDSGLIVFLRSFKNEIKVSRKMIVVELQYSGTFFFDSPGTSGLHANNLISIVKTPSLNEVRLFFLGG